MDNIILTWLADEEARIYAQINGYIADCRKEVPCMKWWLSPKFNKQDWYRMLGVRDYLSQMIKDEVTRRAGEHDCALKHSDCDKLERTICEHCKHYIDCYGEPGTDADFDNYAVQVQNGEGYYDDSGNYHSYNIED